MKKLEVSLNKLMRVIQAKIKETEEADEQRDLYYDRQSIPHITYRRNLPNRIINIETLLNAIPHPKQEPEHTRHMDNIIRLTKEADKNLPNIGGLKLAAFKISVEKIKEKDI